MKRTLSAILAALLLVSATSCGGGGTELPEGMVETVEGDAPIDAIGVDTIIDLFTDMTDLDLRSSCMITPVATTEEAGMYMGYEGFAGQFESGMMLAPMMMAVPFNLMVFRLAPGSDAAAFAADIKQGADPMKWVCVSADDVETAVSGRTVLLLMTPTDMTQPLLDCFAEMSKEGFVPADHLLQPLKDLAMSDLYAKLNEMYAADNYGFMDGTGAAATKDTAFGLGAIDSKLYTDSYVDDGKMDSDSMKGNYLLAMYRLADGTSSEEFIEKLRTADLSALGETPNSIIAYSSDVVVLFAGTEDLGNYTVDLRMVFMNDYRMEITGFTVLD